MNGCDKDFKAILNLNGNWLSLRDPLRALRTSGGGGGACSSITLSPFASWVICIIFHFITKRSCLLYNMLPTRKPRVPGGSKGWYAMCWMVVKVAGKSRKINQVIYHYHRAEEGSTSTTHRQSIKWEFSVWKRRLREWVFYFLFMGWLL